MVIFRNSEYFILRFETVDQTYFFFQIGCRTGSASVSIGYMYPETKNSSIMEVKVSVANNKVGSRTVHLQHQQQKQTNKCP